MYRRARGDRHHIYIYKIYIHQVLGLLATDQHAARLLFSGPLSRPAEPLQAEPVEQRPRVCAVGFASLPTDIQSDILALAAKSKQRATKQNLRLVSRAFEAHTLLNERRCTVHLAITRRIGARRHLPYLPNLASLVISDPKAAQSACAILTRLHLAHLTRLSLALGPETDMSCATHALAVNPQLVSVDLNFGVHASRDRGPYRRAGPLPALPSLACLRSLLLVLPVGWCGPTLHLPVGLANLSALHQLTQLTLTVRDTHIAAHEKARPDYAAKYAHAAMLPTAHALAGLTELRTLDLQNWSCTGSSTGTDGWMCGTALASWQALAAALPAMPHLASLALKDILLMPRTVDASPLAALSCGLSRLSSLRSLTVTGNTPCLIVSANPEDWPWQAVLGAAGVQLAAAVGALTGLEALNLSNLWPFLSRGACWEHLRGLTALQTLTLRDLGSGEGLGGPPSPDGGDGSPLDEMLLCELNYIEDDYCDCYH